MDYKQKFGDLYKTAKEKYNIQQQPKLILRQDEENAQKIFGRTAQYDPENQSITIYITNRQRKNL